MTTITQTRITRISYETSECSRCGGSGQMPFAAYGGICLKCKGSGRMFTSKGAAALRKAEAWKAEHTSVLVSDLTLGDRIYVTNMRGRRVAVTVTEISTSSSVAYIVDGERIPSLEITTTDSYGNITGRNHEPNSTQSYQRVLTQENLQELAVVLARSSGAIIERV